MRQRKSGTGVVAQLQSVSSQEAGYFLVRHYTEKRAMRETELSALQAFNSAARVKLEPKREPVDILVVDHAERASGN
jgi:hypothetical protein